MEIRVSDQPINAENFAEATAFTMAGAAEVGDLASINFSGAPSETASNVHFAMRSIDNVGNKSEIRTASANVPAAAVALAENFDGETNGFAASGDFKTVEVEGRGKVFSSASGEGGSKGASAITSGAIDLTEKTGAYLKFDAKTSLSWGESATVQVSEDGGENWTRVGAMERRSDWSEQGIDLSAFDGKNIQVRFDVQSREGRNSAGMMVDNVKLLADQ